MGAEVYGQAEIKGCNMEKAIILSDEIHNELEIILKRINRITDILCGQDGFAKEPPDGPKQVISGTFNRLIETSCLSKNRLSDIRDRINRLEKEIGESSKLDRS